MAIGDTALTIVTQTADQKNEAACEAIRDTCLNAIRQAKIAVDRANQAIADAPGDKATVMGKFGSDQTDAEALMQKLVALVNDHKATRSSTLSF